MTCIAFIKYKHLDEEIVHIAPDHLKVWEAHELQALNDKLEQYAKSSGNPFTLVPYMRRSVSLYFIWILFLFIPVLINTSRSHTPPEYKEIWPPMPWIVRKFVVPYVLATWHSGWVRLSSLLNTIFLSILFASIPDKCELSRYWKYSPYAMSWFRRISSACMHHACTELILIPLRILTTLHIDVPCIIICLPKTITVNRRR